MAELNSISEVVTTDAPELKTRCYTACYIRDCKAHNRATSITLKGNWLDDAGFETGIPLKVRVMPGCLVLRAQEPVVIPPPPSKDELAAFTIAPAATFVRSPCNNRTLFINF